MAAGFQCQINRGAARFVRRFAQSADFGVIQESVFVPAAAHDPAVPDTTHPTGGLGLARPIPFSASAIALRMNLRSSASNIKPRHAIRLSVRTALQSQ